MIYVVFIMTILLLYRIEQVARYIDLGAAEDADVDDEAGAVVGTLKDIAFEAHELTSVDAYLLATAQRARVDGYVALGIADHTHKAAHLLVGDDGNRAMAVFGTAGYVDHEALDVWQEHYLLAAHEVGAADEDEGGEDDALYELAAAVAPCAHLLLRCYIDLIVFFAVRLRRNACQKPLATKFFGVVVYDGYIPMFAVFGCFWHAYGAVGWCYRRTFNMHRCIAIHNSLVCLAQQIDDSLLRRVHLTLQIYEFIFYYQYFAEKNRVYSCFQSCYNMNLCEPNACHIDSYSLIIKHLATSDLLFVRVSRFEHTALNIYSDTIEDVAVGIVYFPGLDGCEIYLRGVLGVVAHCLTDDAYGDVFLLGCRGPRMARNIHGERNGDACHDAYLLEVAVDAEHGVEILAALGAVFTDDDGKEILCGRRAVGVDDGLHGALPSDGELLPGLLAAVDDVVVAEVFLAQKRHVDKRHAAHVEREEKHVARKGKWGVGCEVESLDAPDVGKADGAARGLVDTGVDCGKGIALRDDAFGHGFVVDAAQDAHIERRGVAAKATGTQPRLIRLDERGGEHGEADVGAVAECGDAAERLSVSVGGALSALGTEHAYMSVHEGEQRVVDSRLRVAVAMDDVGSVVRQSAAVVFADYAIESLHLVSDSVAYAEQRGGAPGRHRRHDEYATVGLVPFVGKDAASGAERLNRITVYNLKIQCAFAAAVSRHPEC